MLAESCVVAGYSRSHVHQGDALVWLMGLPEACVDAVCTDPPYSSGGAFRGDRAQGTGGKYFKRPTCPDFSGDTRDQRSYLAWSSLWLALAFRAAKPGAPVLVFSDWRQLGTTQDALQAGGWVMRGIVPWDKTGAVRKHPGRFSAQAEYVVWGSKGPMRAPKGAPCLPGVYRYPTERKRVHQTAKPVALLTDLLQITPPGGIVLDPFVGGGSTGVAALEGGRRFLGCELSPDIHTTALERLAGAL